MKEEITDIVSKMLENISGVTFGTHFRNTNYLVAGKVFAFVKNEGVAMKLPKETIADLIHKNDISPLVMGKRVMKEWIVISHDNSEEYKKDLELFKQSIAFVAKQHEK